MDRNYFKLRNIEYKVSRVRLYNYAQIKWLQEIYFNSVEKMPKILFDMKKFAIIDKGENFIEVSSQEWYKFMYYLTSIFKNNKSKRETLTRNIELYLKKYRTDMEKIEKKYYSEGSISLEDFNGMMDNFSNVDAFAIFNMIIPYDVYEEDLKKLNLDIDLDNLYLCSIEPHRDRVKREKINLAIKSVKKELSEKDIKEYIKDIAPFEKFEQWCLDTSYLEDETFFIRDINNITKEYNVKELEEENFLSVERRKKQEKLIKNNLKELYEADKSKSKNTYSKTQLLTIFATEEEDRHMIECKVLAIIGKYFKDKNCDMARTKIEDLAEIVKIYGGSK